jgi:hypothetical protein
MPSPELTKVEPKKRLSKPKKGSGKTRRASSTDSFGIDTKGALVLPRRLFSTGFRGRQHATLLFIQQPYAL